MVRRFKSAATAGRHFKADVLDQLAPATGEVASGVNTWDPNGDTGTLVSGYDVEKETTNITANGVPVAVTKFDLTTISE